RHPPLVPVHEIVPVGDDIPERTPVMAERNAAVHAARGLIGERGLRIGHVHFAPVAQALYDRTHRMFHPPDFEKTGGLTHWRRPRSPRRARSAVPPRRSGPPSRARAGNRAASP